MPILKSKFSILNWDKFHQKQISRQYKSVEICFSQLENSIQLKDVKIAVFMIFQKNHFLYRLLIYTKRILMTRKICQIAKSAKRRCKVSSYNQQVQLFLNQGLATGNLQYLVLDLAEGVHLLKLAYFVDQSCSSISQILSSDWSRKHLFTVR